MSDFGRRLDRLERLSSRGSETPNWWRDLLTLWRPSGSPSGDFGLRLAVRNNYLNFYRRGQSIARVEIGRDGMPVAKTHIKYVAPESTVAGQSYVALKDNSIIHLGHVLRKYGGIDDLKSWIKIIDGEPGTDKRGYAGEEKLLVDKVVAANPGVIDLEMGLPAWGDQKTAPRMDIVDIEMSGDSPQVVFWEAKRISDRRMRCQEDELPEVIGQLNKYRRFLEKESHKHLVVEAYRQAARLLQQLHMMVPEATRTKYPLGRPLQDDRAMESLEVADQARLLVFDEKNHSNKHWELHEKRLRTTGMRMQIVANDGPYLLARLP